jgi:hypothetical protein
MAALKIASVVAHGSAMTNQAMRILGLLPQNGGSRHE